MHYHLGYDYFDLPAGTVSEKVCLACLETLSVKRDVLDTRGKWGNSYPPEKQYRVDIFTCQWSEAPWHRQIIALLKEADKTPSSKIADLLNYEVEHIRKTRQATKKESIWW